MCVNSKCDRSNASGLGEDCGAWSGAAAGRRTYWGSVASRAPPPSDRTPPHRILIDLHSRIALITRDIVSSDPAIVSWPCDWQFDRIRYCEWTNATFSRSVSLSFVICFIDDLFLFWVFCYYFCFSLIVRMNVLPYIHTSYGSENIAWIFNCCSQIYYLLINNSTRDTYNDSNHYYIWQMLLWHLDSKSTV